MVKAVALHAESTRRQMMVASIYMPRYGWWFTHEAREHRTHLPPLAHPRAPPGLPAGRRVGAADTGRPGRLPSTGAGDRLGRPGARLPPRRPRALDDPMEGRGAPRLGRPECRPRLQGAHPP